MRRPRFPRFRNIARELWHFRMTPAGKMVLGALLFSSLIGASSLQIPVYQLVCALVALLVTAFLVPMVLRPKVLLEGSFPDRAATGEPVTGIYALTNRSRFPALDLSLGFFDLPLFLTHTTPDTSPVSLNRDESASFDVTLHPNRRGLFQLPRVSPYSLFPFGLFRTPVKTSAAEERNSLLVLPGFAPIESLSLPAHRRYQPGGIPFTSNVGESTEYVGDREYHSGDPLKKIDFKSWARLRHPVVKEFQEEYYYRIALVLDTQVSNRKKEPKEGFPNLEAAVSLTAAIADRLIGIDHVIDLFAAGPEVYYLRAGRNTAQLESVLELLACVEPCQANPFETLVPRLDEHLASVSTLICVLLDWDNRRAELVSHALELGCGCRLFQVLDREEEDTGEVPDDLRQHLTSLRAADILAGRVQELCVCNESSLCP